MTSRREADAYAVLRLRRRLRVRDTEYEIALEGAAGFLPVFETREEAEAFDEDAEIVGLWLDEESEPTRT